MPPADAPAPEPPAAQSPPPQSPAPELPSAIRVPVPRAGAGPGGPVAPAGPESTGAAPPAALTEREVQILAFESKWWKHAGSKEQAIRDAFDLSATRYYQLLNGLLDNPAALAHDAVLIGRLRRLRSTRARVRRR